MKPTLTVEEFNALPVEEKRRQIAQDALNQINCEKYNTSTGTYLRASTQTQINPGDDLRTILIDENAPQCTVCAKGALFLSMVRLRNNYAVDIHTLLNHSVCSVDPAVELQDIFPLKMSHDIECAFEGWAEIAIDPDSDWNNGHEYHHHYQGSTSTRNLIGILNHIIKHGTFNYALLCQEHGIALKT